MNAFTTNQKRRLKFDNIAVLSLSNNFKLFFLFVIDCRLVNLVVFCLLLVIGYSMKKQSFLKYLFSKKTT
ncbi:MAG TPA: hypothetical protein V6D48_23820, partial [Oculatellaceae cyanobacterium]